MWRVIVVTGLGVALAGALAAPTVFAEDPPASGQNPSHQHDSPAAPGADKPAGPMPPHMRQHMEMMRKMAGSGPTMPGQDAFGAIAEVVRILEADPATDWSKVDIERLRQHLIDMNEVVLRAAVKQAPVPGGLAMEITGAGRTEQAIGAMVVPHAVELDGMPDWSARTEAIPGGVRLTVVARKPEAAAVVARIRGLGFAGLITEGAHHQAHHLAMARGEALGHTHTH
jgi:hypothetical protein